MSIIGDIVGAIGSPFTAAKRIVGLASKFIESPEDRHSFELATAELIQARDSEIEQTLRAEMQAKERVIVAELQQGDTFTKRARPSLVYMGLLFAFAETVVRIILVLQGKQMPEGLTTVVPPQFWAAWTGVTGLWVIGRSAEKRGAKNKIVSAITGR